MNELLGPNRKFLFAILTLLAGTVFAVFADKVTFTEWAYFALGLAGLYITGNVGQHWAQAKYDKKPEVK